MEFSRQGCWSGLPCPPPGDLPDPGIKPASVVFPALEVDSLPLSHEGSPISHWGNAGENHKIPIMFPLELLKSKTYNTAFNEEVQQPELSGTADGNVKWYSWNGAGRYSLCPLSMSPVCLLSVENFSQRISLVREMRNAETKDNSQRRLNNTIVVIKHGQGPLVLSQGMWIIFWAISCELSCRYWNTRWRC